VGEDDGLAIGGKAANLVMQLGELRGRLSGHYRQVEEFDRAGGAISRVAGPSG
jgi:hypothetical protein